MDDILDGLTFDVPEPKAEKEPEPTVKARTYERGVERHHARRYFSEKALDETLPWHFEPGDCYHIISRGDIDSLTYLRAVVRQQPIEFMLLSTWCMAITDLEEIHEWMQDGYIGRVDFYVGEIFPGSYAGPYNYLKENCIAGGGQVLCFPESFQGHGRLRKIFRLRNRELGKRQHESEDGADLHIHRHRAGRFL